MNDTKIGFAVIKVGKRTWKVADYSTFGRFPIFEARETVCHSEITALAECERLQKLYDESDAKCIHELSVNPELCSPRRLNQSGTTLVRLAQQGKL